MSKGAVIPTPNLQSFFFEVVHDTARRQKFQPSPEVLNYLVNLLTLFGRSEAIVDKIPARGTHYKTMVSMMENAFTASSTSQAAFELRDMGDAATFIGGYMYGAFARRLVDTDYYIGMGQRAYSSASDLFNSMNTPRRALGPICEELAESLPQVADVLHEIGTNPNNPVDMLRTYELFMKTDSKWAARILRENGIEPLESVRIPNKGELTWC
jgi:hypothetical protein